MYSARTHAAIVAHHDPQRSARPESQPASALSCCWKSPRSISIACDAVFTRSCSPHTTTSTWSSTSIKSSQPSAMATSSQSTIATLAHRKEGRRRPRREALPRAGPHVRQQQHRLFQKKLCCTPVLIPPGEPQVAGRNRSRSGSGRRRRRGTLLQHSARRRRKGRRRRAAADTSGTSTLRARELRAYWLRHASQKPWPQPVVRSGTADRHMLHTSSAQVSELRRGGGVVAIAVGSAMFQRTSRATPDLAVVLEVGPPREPRLHVHIHAHAHLHAYAHSSRECTESPTGKSATKPGGGGKGCVCVCGVSLLRKRRRADQLRRRRRHADERAIARRRARLAGVARRHGRCAAMGSSGARGSNGRSSMRRHRRRRSLRPRRRPTAATPPPTPPSSFEPLLKEGSFEPCSASSLRPLPDGAARSRSRAAASSIGRGRGVGLA